MEESKTPAIILVNGREVVGRDTEFCEEGGRVQELLRRGKKGEEEGRGFMCEKCKQSGRECWGEEGGDGDGCRGGGRGAAAGAAGEGKAGAGLLKLNGNGLSGNGKVNGTARAPAHVTAQHAANGSTAHASDLPLHGATTAGPRPVVAVCGKMWGRWSVVEGMRVLCEEVQQGGGR